MSRLIRFLTALGLLLIAYFTTGINTDISVSLWLATALLLAVTVFLQDSWQMIAIPLVLPLLIAVYHINNRELLCQIVLSLLAALNGNLASLVCWGLAALLFTFEGITQGWQLITLPYLCLGIFLAGYKGNEKDLVSRPNVQEALVNYNYDEHQQLKREVARLKTTLSEQRSLNKEINEEDLAKIGHDVGEVTAKLSLLLFEMKAFLTTEQLKNIPATIGLEEQLNLLRRIIPKHWPQSFFTKQLSEILAETALEKRALLKLRLNRIELTAGEKFVISEMTKALLEENSETEVSLEEGEDGLFYTLRPVKRQEADSRLYKLVKSIGGSLLFGEEEAFLIWRTEQDEHVVNSTP
jgi:hypothetical protein